MATLAELRAKLKSQEDSTGPGRQSSGGGDKAMYPFWNIPNDTTAVLRFLPDGDESNTFFCLLYTSDAADELSRVGLVGSEMCIRDSSQWLGDF